MMKFSIGTFASHTSRFSVPTLGLALVAGRKNWLLLPAFTLCDICILILEKASGYKKYTKAKGKKKSFRSRPHNIHLSRHNTSDDWRTEYEFFLSFFRSFIWPKKTKQTNTEHKRKAEKSKKMCCFITALVKWSFYFAIASFLTIDRASALHERKSKRACYLSSTFYKCLQLIQV